MRSLKLHHWILISMALGAAIGLPLNYLGESGAVDTDTVRSIAHIGKELGGIFLRLLQMLVVPLIVSSLISGVTGMGNLKQLGQMGGRTIAFYLTTSAIAILTGLLFSNLFNPGMGVDLAALEEGATGHEMPAVDESRGLGTVLWDQISSMVPKNPLHAAAEGDMLPVIFFSIVLGVFISMVEHGRKGGEHGEAPYREEADEDEEDTKERSGAIQLRHFFEGLFAVMMRMTLAVIQLAPIGVFGFMLYAAAGSGLEVFKALGMYSITVTAGLLVHACVTLPLILKFFAKKSPIEHAKAMTPALLTAFSTASSNGTLPLTMRCVESSGVSNKVTSFVLPLGATINMDGTALYEVAAVLFIAQITGADLTLAQQLIVAFTALLASVGAAGIPHAGTVMMVVVLGAVGLPTEKVTLILAVDRILDMGRTAVNVWSDSAAAVVVAKSAGELQAPAPEPTAS